MEECSIVMCKDRAHRFLVVKDAAIFLCVRHRALWARSGEQRRATEQVSQLVYQEASAATPYRKNFDAPIRRAWLLAANDFVQRVSQEERNAS